MRKLRVFLSNYYFIWGIKMIKKFLTLITISLLFAACGGGGGTAASSGGGSGSSDSSGEAAQGYQVPGSFQPVDSEG